MNRLEELSREVSYVLRHAPWKYELEMDGEGWVLVAQLLEGLHGAEQWKDISEADLREMIEQSQKKRHELKDGKIRAFYGHSVPMKILKEEKMPPEILYHGTARRFLASIFENGLRPQGRQYVHLSQDVETAKEVGSRHDGKPCVLVIDAKAAWNDGVKFYLGNEKVWLADAVPGRYIRKSEERAGG